MKLRAIPLLLSTAILLCGLASCADSDTETSDTTAAASTADTTVTDDKLICDPGLPAADFGGEKFIFAMRGTDGDYNDITAKLRTAIRSMMPSTIVTNTSK